MLETTREKGTRAVQRRSTSGRCVIWLIPRRRSIDAFKKLLPGYELAAASSLTALRKLSRSIACDAFIVHSPLGWAEAEIVCRSIRSHDAHTPIIVYGMQPHPAERREIMAAGAQAYVARSDDPHNLQGRAAQLIMLSELRSMDALEAHAGAMQECITGRVTKLARKMKADPAAAAGAVQTRLKMQAARLFTAAGGTRANFERLWPSIYQRALRALGNVQR